MDVSPTLEIRRAEAGDLDAILHLYRQLSPSDAPTDRERVASAWQALLNRYGLTVLVAVLDGRVAATCTLIVVPNLTRGARPYAIIENVVTDEASRKQGIGEGLMQHAIDLARSEGCYKIILTTARTEPSLFRFYERLGFRRGTKTAFELRFV